MAVKDTQDGYGFLYPFGWQEIAVDGQDVVFKDVIEPLESVSWSSWLGVGVDLMRVRWGSAG